MSQESWEILDLGSWILGNGRLSRSRIPRCLDRVLGNLRIPAVSIETKTFQLKRPGSKIQDPRFLRTLAEASWNPISWILPVSIETFPFQLKRPVLDLGGPRCPGKSPGKSWILDLGSRPFQLKRFPFN